MPRKKKTTSDTLVETPPPVAHGMRLAQVKPEIKSDALREILRDQKAKAHK